MEEGVDTVGNGVLWLFAEDKTVLEFLLGRTRAAVSLSLYASFWPSKGSDW